MSDPRGKRYTMPVVQRARDLGKAGWSYTRVRQLLEDEFGVSPSLDTIGVWLSEDYATNRRESQARARRRHREKLGWQFKLPGAGGPEYRAAFVQLLDAEGVSVDAIGKVCSIVLGDVSDDELWMAIDGVPS